MNLNRFTNAELADIHFIYGLANGNRLVAVRLYGERHLTRWQPNHQTFTEVHQNLAEHGWPRTVIEVTGRPRTARTPIFGEGVLHAVDRNPSTSELTRAVSTQKFRTTVHRVLQSEALILFHVQRVQLLQPDDPPRRVAFV
ncbi:uncharacterized protein TNCV_3659221 [Trichonephila clavipes]|nr:uncharacterized protein TNCV_3659221 [Trichonephila clavipes]